MALSRLCQTQDPGVWIRLSACQRETCESRSLGPNPLPYPNRPGVLAQLFPLKVFIMGPSGPRYRIVITKIGNSSKNDYMFLCVCVLSRFSHVRLFATPWTVAPQAPLSMGILQPRILEWVAMPSSRGSSWPKDQARVSQTRVSQTRVSHSLLHWQVGSLPPAPPGKSCIYVEVKWSEVKLLSRQLFATPWTVAHQAPLSMGSSRPEYWSG